MSVSLYCCWYAKLSHLATTSPRNSKEKRPCICSIEDTRDFIPQVQVYSHLSYLFKVTKTTKNVIGSAFLVIIVLREFNL